MTWQRWQKRARRKCLTLLLPRPRLGWMVFGKLARERDGELLKRLDDFPGAVLVAGCQRSGTSQRAKSYCVTATGQEPLQEPVSDLPALQ